MHFTITHRKFENTEFSADKIAVVGADRTLTWHQLQRESDELATLLTQLQATASNCAVIWGHKDAATISAITACMQKHIPYIPVDSASAPVGRMLEIMADAGAAVLIDTTNQLDHALGNISAPDITRVSFNNNGWAVKSECGIGLLRNSKLMQTDLIYTLFTSGSTGRPKGVQISHEAVSAFLDWIKRDFGFFSSDVFFNQAPLNFDLSCYELFSFLEFGATLVLREQAASPTETIAMVNANNCSVWVSTPSFVLLYLREDGFTHNNLPKLRQFLFCGETLPTTTARNLRRKFPDAQIVNSYGPTEATVACTRVVIQDAMLESNDPLPVGAPMASDAVAILDESGATHFGPDSPEGQIVIIGANVSHGYLNNAELNASKFSLIHGKRAYNTGDFGQLRANQLYFFGRKDGFIKLNGFRVEMEEISERIAALPGVLEAVTLPVRVKGEVRRLVSFVIPKDPNTKPNLSDIIVQLRASLPTYMIPSEIFTCDRFPLNANSKLDAATLLRSVDIQSS